MYVKSRPMLTLGSSRRELGIPAVTLRAASSEYSVAGTNSGCFPEAFCLWFGSGFPKGGCFVLLLCCHSLVANLGFCTSFLLLSSGHPLFRVFADL